MDNAFESVRELVGLENVERAIIRGREGPVQLLIAYLSTQRQVRIESVQRASSHSFRPKFLL